MAPIQAHPLVVAQALVDAFLAGDRLPGASARETLISRIAGALQGQPVAVPVLATLTKLRDGAANRPQDDDLYSTATDPLTPAGHHIFDLLTLCTDIVDGSQRRRDAWHQLRGTAPEVIRSLANEVADLRAILGGLGLDATASLTVLETQSAELFKVLCANAELFKVLCAP